MEETYRTVEDLICQDFRARASRRAWSAHSRMISSSSAVSDRTSSLTHLSDPPSFRSWRRSLRKWSSSWSVTGPRIRLGCFFSAYGRGGTGDSSEEQEQEAESKSDGSGAEEEARAMETRKSVMLNVGRFCGTACRLRLQRRFSPGGVFVGSRPWGILSWGGT